MKWKSELSPKERMEIQRRNFAAMPRWWRKFLAPMDRGGESENARRRRQIERGVLKAGSRGVVEMK